MHCYEKGRFFFIKNSFNFRKEIKDNICSSRHGQTFLEKFCICIYPRHGKSSLKRYSKQLCPKLTLRIWAINSFSNFLYLHQGFFFQFVCVILNIFSNLSTTQYTTLHLPPIHLPYLLHSTLLYTSLIYNSLIYYTVHYSTQYTHNIDEKKFSDET